MIFFYANAVDENVLQSDLIRLVKSFSMLLTSFLRSTVVYQGNQVNNKISENIELLSIISSKQQKAV